MKGILVKVLIVLISTVVLTEIIYRLTGRFQVYSEITGNGYQTSYGQVMNTWYHTWSPHLDIVPPNADFHYRYQTNRFGLREKEVEEHKEDSTLRILITGDSFTEGFGAPYDSTWPRLLEKHLNKTGFRAEIIDAGSSGSDIFYDYMLFKDKLAVLKPDLVIASINSSDYQDYFFRGGMERFYKDGTTHYAPAPWYEPLYHYSRFFRAIMTKVNTLPYNGLYLTEEKYYTARPNVVENFIDVLKQYKMAAAKNNAAFVVLVYPIPAELLYHHRVNVFNLATLDSLSARLQVVDISVINIKASLLQVLQPLPRNWYTYEHDEHYTPNAYATMAILVYQALIEKRDFLFVGLR